VRRRHPDATLELVGGEPSTEMHDAAGPGTTLHGQVDSIADYLDQAAVVAAPIRRGGGMRIKVLEALAAGKAVVASPLAAAGLEVEDGRELVLAETDDEFADAISLLLAEPERRVSLGRAARSWAENGLGWPRIVAAYEALYTELVSTTAPAATSNVTSATSGAAAVGAPHEAGAPVTSRHRILVVAPFPPSRRAAHGGAQVVAELIAGLAAHHDVGLLYLERVGEQPLDPELADACVLVEKVSRPRRSPLLRVVQRIRLGARLLGGKPRWVVASSVDAFRTRLADVVERFEPEVVQLEFVVMGDYADTLEPHRAKGTRVVLTHHDPRTRATREFTSGLRGIRRLEFQLDARAWSRFERRALAQVDAVVVFTERDREGLLPLTDTPIVRIRPPQRVPLEPEGAVGTDPPTIVFTGNFEHEPNEDAARHLAGKLFPAVRAEVPEARLQIVGANPSAALRRFDHDAIEVTGFVADVAPYIADAALVVAPIRSGGGLRVKVIDALSAGKAVVGTPRAFEGLDIVDGREAIVADGDEALVAACIRLLRDPDERERLGRNAHAWALANVGSQDSIARFGALYDELLGG
jgi:glycosyltransferase involved in cell wall biosynthesis